MKTLIWIIVLIPLFIVALSVKWLFFPTVKDAWFAMDRDHLRKVPPGIVVFRPTHFHDNLYKFLVRAPYEHDGRRVFWIMGRDLPLRIALAVAYNVNRATVELPADAPQGHFDFLVTTSDDPTARLQSAIRDKLGLVAQEQTRDTSALAIKIADPGLPGLTVSSPAESSNAEYRKGRVYLTHVKIKSLTDQFERMIGDTPLVDETGLTNFYDFSIPWNGQIGRRSRLQATARATIDKMLGNLGLTLEPVRAPVQVLIVKHL